MKNLFDAALADEVKQRTGRLRRDSGPRWGRMTVSQAVAHCAAALEMALGDIKPHRALGGRLIGSVIKPMIVGNDQPFRRGSPTLRELVVSDDRELETERARLRLLIDRFASGGPAACTAHPHSLSAIEHGGLSTLSRTGLSRPA